jgi:hypothetical protein
MTWDILGPQKNRISLIFALPGMVRLAGDVWLHCHARKSGSWLDDVGEVWKNAMKSWCYDSSWRCLQKGCIKYYWIIWGLGSTCSRLCSRVAWRCVKWILSPRTVSGLTWCVASLLIYGVTLRCLKGTRRFVGKYGTCGTRQSISIHRKKHWLPFMGMPDFQTQPRCFFPKEALAGSLWSTCRGALPGFERSHWWTKALASAVGAIRRIDSEPRPSTLAALAPYQVEDPLV